MVDGVHSRPRHTGLLDVGGDNGEHWWRKSQVEEPVSCTASLLQLQHGGVEALKCCLLCVGALDIAVDGKESIHLASLPVPNLQWEKRTKMAINKGRTMRQKDAGNKDNHYAWTEAKRQGKWTLVSVALLLMVMVSSNNWGQKANGKKMATGCMRYDNQATVNNDQLLCFSQHKRKLFLLKLHQLLIKSGQGTEWSNWVEQLVWPNEVSLTWTCNIL